MKKIMLLVMGAMLLAVPLRAEEIASADRKSVV